MVMMVMAFSLNHSLDLSRIFRPRLIHPDGETDSPDQAPGLHFFPVICPYHELILYDMIPLCGWGRQVHTADNRIFQLLQYVLYVAWRSKHFGVCIPIPSTYLFASFSFNSPSPMFSIVGTINCILLYVVFVVVVFVVVIIIIAVTIPQSVLALFLLEPCILHNTRMV